MKYYRMLGQTKKTIPVQNIIKGGPLGHWISESEFSPYEIFNIGGHLVDVCPIDRACTVWEEIRVPCDREYFTALADYAENNYRVISHGFNPDSLECILIENQATKIRFAVEVEWFYQRTILALPTTAMLCDVRSMDV